MFKAIKRFALCIDGVTTALYIVEFTPVSFRSANRNSRSTETNRFRYIKDTVIMRGILTIETHLLDVYDI